MGIDTRGADDVVASSSVLRFGSSVGGGVLASFFVVFWWIDRQAVDSGVFEQGPDQANTIIIIVALWKREWGEVSERQ